MAPPKAVKPEAVENQGTVVGHRAHAQRAGSAAVADLQGAGADRGHAAVGVAAGKGQGGGPGLGEPRGPAIVGDDAADREVGGVMTIRSPLAEPAKAPPLMMPDVLPIRPPLTSVSEPAPVIVTPFRTGQIQRVERLGGSDGALRAGRLDVECAVGT